VDALCIFASAASASSAASDVKESIGLALVAAAAASSSNDEPGAKIAADPSNVRSSAAAADIMVFDVTVAGATSVETVFGKVACSGRALLSDEDVKRRREIEMDEPLRKAATATISGRATALGTPNGELVSARGESDGEWGSAGEFEFESGTRAP
jgi:hypothetical protein